MRITNSIFLKEKFRKYGKKALVLYLCWCLVKGLLFIFVGYRLFK